MAHIKTIKVRIRTGNRQKGGTDGWVYLGIGGREFSLARAGIDDFAKGELDEFILGEGGNVEDVNRNDPNFPQINLVDLELYPVYIRFEPENREDEWNFEGAKVIAVTHEDSEVQYDRMLDEAHLWLGQRLGKVCYLKKGNTHVD